jgi:hypothetical protein
MVCVVLVFAPGTVKLTAPVEGPVVLYPFSPFGTAVRSLQYHLQLLADEFEYVEASLKMNPFEPFAQHLTESTA